MSTPVHPPLAELVETYTRHAQRMPVAAATVRSYVSGVTAFAEWLGTQTKHDYDDVLLDQVAATHAVRDYRRYLLTERKLAPRSVDAAITAIASLYSWLGMARPDVRAATPKGYRPPESLEEEQLREILRASERRGVRDHAMINLLYAAGLRIGELAALDVDDVPLSERKGLVIVRAGKGDKPREVPLNTPSAITTLNRWLRVRRDQHHIAPHTGPLFVTKTNQRLAVRSIRHVVTRVGEAAGVELKPHTLRHTFARNLIDKGVDLPTVSELLGHASVNTTMVYVHSRQSHRDAAVTHLEIDY